MPDKRLGQIPPNQQTVGADKWPFVGERTPRESSDPITISVSGLVDNPQTFQLDQFLELPTIEQVVDIHCVTRWSKLGVLFRGVLLEELLKICQVQSDAKFVSLIARSQRRHSTSLQLDQAIENRCMIASAYDGKPLPVEHGGPIRSIMPGKYFYKSVKWIEEIVLLDQDQLGYWEKDAGYHNHADPWQEERYILPSLTKREAAELMQNLNFRKRELLGIVCNDRDLNGLDAAFALLRNAEFRNASLVGANFEQANLSNAHFENSNLQSANFLNADLEGANLQGADMRECDLRGASLFGATFVRENSQTGELEDCAKLDSSTQIKLDQLEALTDIQRQFVVMSVGD